MEREKSIMIIGSRESLLAVRQSEIVLEYLQRNFPQRQFELLTMKTTGDKILEKRLDEIGGKGLFVKELDQALMEGRTDLSVHSLKDMPAEIPEDLPIIGFSQREDPRDVLVLPAGMSDLSKINFTKPIGTSSRRRILQAQELFPQAHFESVRGNVLTRLRKLDEGHYCALILAAAGLRRLGLEKRISRYFSPDEIIPSAGQGILALQGRRGEDYACLDGFVCPRSAIAAAAERAFVRALGGGCTSPIAAHAEFMTDGHEEFITDAHEEFVTDGHEEFVTDTHAEFVTDIQGREKGPDRGREDMVKSCDRLTESTSGLMTLLGFYYDEETQRSYRKIVTLAVSSPQEGRNTGIKLAEDLLAEVKTRKLEL